MRFSFPSPPRSGRDVVRLRHIRKSFGDLTVYSDLNLTIERGQKTVLVGPNGAGKSTLLKLLAARIDPSGGERVLGHNAQVAYYGQHQVDELNLDNTVLTELTAVVDTSRVNPRSMLGAFMFSGDDVEKRVEVLSGGERARLALCKLLAQPVNLLCMDEPTNHLDLSSRDVLEDALTEYPGTVVLITHDRHLIRSVADSVIDVRAGKAQLHLGSYDDYLDRVESIAPATPALSMSSGANATTAAPHVRDEVRDKRAEAERRNRLHRETAPIKKRLKTVETQLVAAEAKVAELTRAMADPQIYDDGERVKTIVAEHETAKDHAAQLFTQWEQLATQLEQVTARVG
jgi:ATP-binding cassette subfamily F protein 3